MSVRDHSISFQTVDIAVLDRKSNPVRVLLGKRKHEDAYRFIGGFVDVEDNSLEEAAMRELKEECGLQTLNCKYTGSFRIDDPRFREGADKIMTAFFCCDYISGEPVASDDIHEVKWFELDGEITVVKEHQTLLFWLRRFQKRYDNLLTYIENNNG